MTRNHRVAQRVSQRYKHPLGNSAISSDSTAVKEICFESCKKAERVHSDPAIEEVKSYIRTQKEKLLETDVVI